jgi:hypothetical protein
MRSARRIVDLRLQFLVLRIVPDVVSRLIGPDRLLPEFREFHQFAPAPRIPLPRRRPRSARNRATTTASGKHGYAREIVPPKKTAFGDSASYRRRRVCKRPPPETGLSRITIQTNEPDAPGVSPFLDPCDGPFGPDLRRATSRSLRRNSPPTPGRGREDPGSPTRTFRSPRTAALRGIRSLPHRQAGVRKKVPMPFPVTERPGPEDEQRVQSPRRSTLSRTTPQTSAPDRPFDQNLHEAASAILLLSRSPRIPCRPSRRSP